MAKRKKKEGFCAYCGTFGTTTRDHVIPRCMFPPPVPQDVITVPACNDCNNRKSQHDDFLRDLLVCDIAAEDSIKAMSIFPKVLRASETNRSIASRLVSDESREVPILNANGQPEIAWVSQFDETRSNEMFGFLIRGLHAALCGSTLPITCKISVSRLFKRELDETIDWFNKHGANAVRTIGEGVFSCAYRYVPSRPGNSAW